MENLYKYLDHSFSEPLLYPLKCCMNALGSDKSVKSHKRLCYKCLFEKYCMGFKVEMLVTLTQPGLYTSIWKFCVSGQDPSLLSCVRARHLQISQRMWQGQVTALLETLCVEFKWFIWKSLEKENRKSKKFKKNGGSRIFIMNKWMSFEGCYFSLLWGLCRFWALVKLV